MKVTSLDTSKSFKPQIFMLVAVGVASVLSGIAPASRAVWFTEMFWAWGLVAILILTWRRFRFSTAAISIRIVEIYRSEEAYKAHLATPHFRTYK